MRHQYIFDGLNGGTLSVYESAEGCSVTLCLAVDGGAFELELDEDDFRELAELRYRLQFDRPDVARLRAV